MSFGKAKNDNGAAAVEFALTLPLILILLFGVIDFGRLFFVQISLTSASREAARASTFVMTSCIPAGPEADLNPDPIQVLYKSCNGLVGQSNTPFFFSADFLDEISNVANASAPGVIRISRLKSNSEVLKVQVDVKSSCHQGLISPTPLPAGSPSPGTDTEIQLSTLFDWILPIESISSGSFRVKATGYMKCLD